PQKKAEATRASASSYDNPHSVSERVGWVQNDDLPLREPADDLSFALVALPKFHHTQPGSAFFNHEHGPFVTAAAKAASGYLQFIVFAPYDHSNLDAVAVAELVGRTCRILELDDHVDALFLDAECRHLHEAGRLDAANPAMQGLFTAPLIDEDRCAWRDSH